MFGFELRNNLSRIAVDSDFATYQILARGTVTSEWQQVSFSNPNNLPVLLFVRPALPGLFSSSIPIGGEHPGLYNIIATNQFRILPYRGYNADLTQAWNSAANKNTVFKYLVVSPVKYIASATSSGLLINTSTGESAFDSSKDYFTIDYIYNNPNYNDFDFTVNLNAPFPGQERYILANSLYMSKYMQPFGGYWYEAIPKMAILSETQVRFQRSYDYYFYSDGADWGNGSLQLKGLMPMVTGFGRS